MDEVHDPYIIDAGGRTAAFPQLRFHPPFRRFLAQLQTRLPVKPVNSLAVDRPAFALKQDMDTAIAVPNPRLRDLLDPLLEVGLIHAFATIVVAGSFRPRHAAGSPYADLPCAANIIDQLAPPIRPQSFRETTSCNIALSRLGSATGRLSLATNL